VLLVGNLLGWRNFPTLSTRQQQCSERERDDDDDDDDDDNDDDNDETIEICMDYSATIE
jgi:hypothetical protein